MSDHLRRIWIPLLLLIALSIIYIAYPLVMKPTLPEAIAMQYDSDGKPTRFSDTAELTWVTVLTGSLMLLLFGGIAILFPKFPDSTFNMPHRDFWLAPERRAKVLAEFSNVYLLFGSATLLFLLGVDYLIVKANTEKENVLHLGWLLPVFIAVTVLFVLYCILRFRKLPEGS